MRKVHLSLCLLASALAPLATAQLGSARSMMSNALTRLGQEQQQYIEFTGTEQVGTTSIPLYTIISTYRKTSGSQLTQYLELKHYKNNILQERIVADGTNLWFYDARKHTYATWAYNDGKTKNPNRSMLLFIKGQVSQEVGISLQSLVEAHEGATQGSFWLSTRWNPWMPTATTTVAGGDITTAVKTPTYRELVYRLSSPVPGTWQLNEFRYYTDKVVAGKISSITLHGRIFHNTLHTGTIFTFNPGTAKPVSISNRQSG